MGKLMREKVKTYQSLADLVARLGGVPLHRICYEPSPGTATEEHVLGYMGPPYHRLFELVDGTLVEKPVGYSESTMQETSAP